MAVISAKVRYGLLFTSTILILGLFLFLHDQWTPGRIAALRSGGAPEHPKQAQPEPVGPDPPKKENEPTNIKHEDKPTPVYKHLTTSTASASPIKENFPLAARAKSPADLPQIPSWNKPPSVHVPEKTPLFIGFTRNWPLLQQCIVGYITAGWPPEDIYVVENTGTFDANAQGRLTLQNPFYLDYHRLTHIFGINVITTPTLLTFAQLQNWYLSEALNRGYPHYFWSHMDVLPQSDETRSPYKSLYIRCVDTIRESSDPQFWVGQGHKPGRWALRYFSYDWLTLMNTTAMVEVGGWDSMISYYGTDCDLYERMRMLGFATSIADAGRVFDLGQSLDDLEVLYRRKPTAKEQAAAEAIVTEATTKEAEKPTRRKETHLRRLSWPGSTPAPGEDTLNSTVWHALQIKLEAMMHDKVHGAEIRNAWQTKQTGGQGEPYYRDMSGFEEALEITIHAGEAVYRAKWGQKRCDLRKAGLKHEDAWRVVKAEDVEGICDLPRKEEEEKGE